MAFAIKRNYWDLHPIVEFCLIEWNNICAQFNNKLKVLFSFLDPQNLMSYKKILQIFKLFKSFILYFLHYNKSTYKLISFMQQKNIRTLKILFRFLNNMFYIYHKKVYLVLFFFISVHYYVTT